jgi:NAD(P)-dependent dehydrogenase (short-subunit alcohol dehydrogenase family)
MEDIKNKIVIVTGGNKGIGRAIAFSLAKRGASVTICGRSTESLDTTCKEIRDAGGACSFVTTDVTNENQVNLMVHKTLRDFGRIDILINNAGVGIFKPIWECSLTDWNYVMDTNLKGYFLCSKAVIPIMKKQNEGYILNVASGAGRQGIENLSIYCASKFGTIGLSESMRKDLWKFGIQVDYICPGYVKTGFFKEVSPDYQQMHNGEEPEVVAEEVLRRITHGRRTKNFVLNHLGRWLKLKNMIGLGIRSDY